MNFDQAPLQRPSRDEGIRIVHVASGATWRIIVTAHKAARCWVHFIDGRTRPCAAPESPCPACMSGAAKRFEAYLGCWNISRNAAMLLALPEGAWVKFEQLAGDMLKTSLRGSVWSFSRSGNTKRGPITVEWLMQEPDAASIPRGLHVPQILYRAWQLQPPKDAGEGLQQAM